MTKLAIGICAAVAILAVALTTAVWLGAADRTTNGGGGGGGHSKSAIPPSRRRDYSNTLATQSEWLQVDVLQALGRFIDHTPFYRFPNRAMTVLMWRQTLSNHRAAVRVAGHYNATFSDYFVMNAVTNSLVTSIFVPLAVVSWAIDAAIGGQEADLVWVEVCGPSLVLMLHGYKAPESISAVREGMRATATAMETAFVGAASNGSNETTMGGAFVQRYKPLLAAMRKLAAVADLVVTRVAENDAIAVKFEYSVLALFSHECTDLAAAAAYEFDVASVVARLPPMPAYVDDVGAPYRVVDRVYRTAIVPVEHLLQLLRDTDGALDGTTPTLAHIFDF
jgi:hypothetical protein